MSLHDSPPTPAGPAAYPIPVRIEREAQAAAVQSTDAGHSRRRGMAMVLVVVAADWCVYQGNGGYAGWAALMGLAPLAIAWGIGGMARRRTAAWLAAAIGISALRLVWQGNVPLVTASLVILAAFAMACHGLWITAATLGWFLIRLLPSSVLEIPNTIRAALGLASRGSQVRWINIGMPIVVSGCFCGFFLMANPDALAWTGDWMERNLTSAFQWIAELDIGEVLFCALAAGLGMGAMTPRMLRGVWSAMPAKETAAAGRLSLSWYVPMRNTLVAVIAVFAVYLVIEFRTLWFRELPEGFYYSGYAHQGAAWLTVALAMATLVLSLAVRGGVDEDPRVRNLRRLAWIWSGMNFLLAIAAYHRLTIYIEFNGMSRMRIVGMYGITCVVIGFALMLRKIYLGYSFRWLVRQQAMAFLSMLFLLSLTPMDVLAHGYNVYRISRGDSAPTVQVTEHDVSAEGWLVLWPLVDSDHETIREGILAMMADEYVRRRQSRKFRSRGWRSWQLSDDRLLRHLTGHQDRFSIYVDNSPLRTAAIQRFQKYAYQWY